MGFNSGFKGLISMAAIRSIGFVANKNPPSQNNEKT